MSEAKQSDSTAELGNTTTWYEVLMYYGTDTMATINAVQVLHETEHQIVLAGVAKGNARRRKADGYFRTWADAHQHLLDESDRHLTQAREKLQQAKTRHFNVANMPQQKRTAAQGGCSHADQQLMPPDSLAGRMKLYGDSYGEVPNPQYQRPAGSAATPG